MMMRNEYYCGERFFFMTEKKSALLPDVQLSDLPRLP
jgi:hypothetical protein